MWYFTLTEGRQTKCETNMVQFDMTTDMVVAGLGTAGSMAAICGAEYGLDVIGVDPNSGMGGLSTYGCVWDYYYGSNGGRFEEINQECIRMTDDWFAYGEPPENGKDFRCFNGAAKSVVLEKAAIAAGCRLLYETVVTGVYMEGRKMVGVSCLGMDGETFTIAAKQFVDSTGDIWLCRLAGIPYRSGREYDGRQMLFSKSVIMLQNGFVRGVWFNREHRENKTPLELSRAILKCGVCAPCLEDRYYEKNRMVYEGTVLGVREAPRVVTDTEIRLIDVLTGVETEEPLFYAFSPVDNVNGVDEFDSEAQRAWRLACGTHELGLSIGIPLGALLPKDYEGLIVAGKGVGVDSDLAACVRMRKDMEKCGEAVAAVAFLAIQDDVSPRDIAYDGVAALLRKTRCLDEENNIGFAQVWDCMARRPISPLETEEIRRQLKMPKTNEGGAL